MEPIERKSADSRPGKKKKKSLYRPWLGTFILAWLFCGSIICALYRQWSTAVIFCVIGSLMAIVLRNINREYYDQNK